MSITVDDGARHGRARPTSPFAELVQWWCTGGWYLVVAVATVGFASPVGFVHAAVRTRAHDLWGWAAVYVAGVVAVFVLASNAPHDGAGTPTGLLAGLQVALTVIILIVAPFHLAAVRRRVFGLRPRSGLLPAGAYRDDPAVAAVLAQRQRRADARLLATSDPRLARDLGIGRPDLGRGYNDGGLVELNTASGPVLASLLDLSPGQVRQILDLRGYGTLLTDVEDLFAYTELPFAQWDRIRERAVVVGPRG
jgi:hypothetical protein